MVVSLPEKRALLKGSDNESEDVTIDDMDNASTAILYKSSTTTTTTATTPTILWYLRQAWLRPKLILILLLMFICSYFLIDPPDLDNSNSIVHVHHQSNVLDMEAVNPSTRFKQQTALTIDHQTNPLLLLSTTITTTTTPTPTISTSTSTTTTIPVLPKGYLVYSNSCHIEELNPYKSEVMRHFRRVPYKPCKHQLPLTRVHYDVRAQQYVLRIDPEAFPQYSVKNSLRCCHIGVERADEMKNRYTACNRFQSNAQLANTTDSIIVKCRTEKKEIYVNGHAMIPERVAIRERLQEWRSRDQAQRVPSVLMIGIDSISRVNLIRSMPKTAQYLYDNDWFELAGYNKMGDNTFPNLMALMTGYNMSVSMKRCNPYKVGGLDRCDFIWKLFREHGYVTGYGEDAVKINTFNYLKKGFKEPPVDYYMRPYLLAAEKMLDTQVVQGLPHCMGYKTEAEHVYDYAHEFAQRFRNDSYFGFFWTNTHSHSDISQSSSMDDYLKDYLQRLVAMGTMENSIVVFLSDHGMRFGPARNTWSGHLEERLPFLFIWLPKFMRQAHPEFVNALRLNRNRLTTPYDLHLTLKHFLVLSGRTERQEPEHGTQSCPQCQSLLLPVPLERSCENVGIEDHWCTCWSFEKVNKKSKQMQNVANYVVQYLNDYVASFRNGSLVHLCVPLSLVTVKAAYKAHSPNSETPHIQIYWLTFYTVPNDALYESTVRYNSKLPVNENMIVTGSVSRLNSYNGEADCISDFSAKKYCYCRRAGG